MKPIFASVAFLCLLFSHAIFADNDARNFVQRNFVDGESVVEKKIWLIGDQKKATTEILGHPYHQLRVTYWTSPENTAKSVWILQEIGKERFIDVGIVIESNEIRKLEILAFRESRGWEVKLPFFTAQFDGNRLTKEHKLEKRVDAITGATLSWRAVTGVAKMALYLNGQRPEK